MNNYVIASSKNWFDKNLESKKIKSLKPKVISCKEDLNLNNLTKINPRYIFFTHWNWIVEKEIFEKFDCIVFHTAPLPYGRGGSPVQNLILRGFQEAPVCSLKMTSEIDGGPIYLKKNIKLNGTIDQIFKRIAKAVEDQIFEISTKTIQPEEQKGKVVNFSRLTNADNKIDFNYSISEVYDRIRMVDGLDYPNAYMEFDNFKLLFKNAKLSNNSIKAEVTFKFKK